MHGRERHLLVGTEGLVLKAKVHSAKVPDQDGSKLLLGGRKSGSLAALTPLVRRPVRG